MKENTITLNHALNAATAIIAVDGANDRRQMRLVDRPIMRLYDIANAEKGGGQ
jgi:hypothetical protein